MARFSIPSESSSSTHSEFQDQPRVPSASLSPTSREASLTERFRRSRSPSPPDRRTLARSRSRSRSPLRSPEESKRSRSLSRERDEDSQSDQHPTTPTPPRSIKELLVHGNIGSPSDQDGPNKGHEQTLRDLILGKRLPPALPTEKGFQGLPESLIWHTLVSLLRAVAYLHTGGGGGEVSSSSSTDSHEDWMSIVHNSITPTNIFYTPPIALLDGRRTIPTYGLCRLHNFTRSVVLPGRFDPVYDEEVADRREAFEHLYFSGEKTGYEAPEIVGNGNEIPGPESDLWSIGAVLIAMMTGGRTIWDLILDIEFLNQAKPYRRRPRATLAERWRGIPLIHRQILLQNMAGSAEIVSALPEKYSLELRVLTEGLVVFDPLDRGGAADVLEDAIAEVEIRKTQGLEDFREPSAADKRAEDGRKYRQTITEAERWLDDIEAAEQLHRELQEASDWDN